MIISLVSGFPFNPIAFAIGLGITSLFSIIFPALLLIFWLATTVTFTQFEFLMRWLNLLIEWGDGLVAEQTGFEVTIFLLLGALCWPLLPKSWLRAKVLISLLMVLIDSSSILNLPHSTFYAAPKRRIEVPISHRYIKKSSRKSDGYQVLYRKGLKCRYKIGHGRYLRRCSHR